MGNLSVADWGIFVVAGWVAVTALVRLMLVRRDRLVIEFRQQVVDEERRRKRAEQAAKKSTLKKAA